MNATPHLPPRRWFQRLRWKLTFSYTLVTVATLVTFELILLLLVLLFLGSSLFTNLLIVNLRDPVATEAAVYFEQTPPNSDELQLWLNGLIEQQTQVRLDGSVEQGQQMQLGSINVNGAEEQLLVLDRETAVLARIGQQATVDLDELRTHDTVTNALAGETDDSLLSGEMEDGRLITAVPILAEDDTPVGALVLTFRLPIFQPSIILPILQVVLLTTIPLTIGAVIIGTIFGFFGSRGLTRRIEQIANAANAWSEGEFTAVSPDRSGDELGQLSQQLNRMAEQLENLIETNQTLATAEERNRLARDLHDSVKQQLFATSMQLGAATSLFESEPKAAKGHLETAVRLANQAQKELTGLIHELRPVALEGKRLSDALQLYLDDWSNQTHIDATLTVKNEQPLPLDVEQTLFRIAQEALANVARHSQATSVQLDLRWEQGRVQMRIADDGIGFDQSVTPSGVGLNSMNERLAMINGRLQLNSRPQNGTTLQADVPLANAETGKEA